MFYYIYTPLIAFFTNIVLIIIVLQSNFRARINQICALFLLTMSFWGLFIFYMRSSPDIDTAIWWDRLALFNFPLISILFYHLTLYLVHQKPARWALFGGYGISFILSFLALTPLLVRDIELKPDGYAPTYGILSMFLFPWGYFVVTVALVMLAKFCRASHVRKERAQALLLIVGMLLSLSGGAVDVFRSFGLAVPPMGIVGNIFFGILVSIAVLQYRFLDTRILRKGLVYTFASGLVAAVYVLAIFLLGGLFQTYLSSFLIVNLIIVLVISIILQPILRVMQRIIDKWFYRERYDHLRALEQFAREIKEVTNLGCLADSMVKMVSEAMGAAGVFLMLVDSEGKQFSTVAAYGRETDFKPVLNSNSSIVRWLKKHDKFLQRREFNLNPQLQAIIQKEKTVVDQTKAELLFPLKVDKKLTGILILSAKPMKTYSEEDRRLLEIASRQLAIALDNSRLYEESKQAYKKLEAAQEQLIWSERLKAIGQMSSGVAHDFNNVLTTIMGRTQLSLSEFKKRGMTDKIKRNLELIEQAAFDAEQMICKLQDFARIRTDLAFDVIDLNEVLRSSIEMVKPRLDEESETRKNKIRLSFDLSELLPVEAQAGELRESFVNILINAIDAMPSGGKLTVSTQQNDGTCIVAIADTGIGMSPETQKRIFEPFFSTKMDKGIGIGLSTVYGTITRHGGTISLDSEIGRGSTFTVRLPIAQHDKKTAHMSRDEIQLSGAQVLLVEDDEGARNVLCEMLSEEGVHVETAASGSEALSLLNRNVYGVLICDLGLPDLSGLDVIAAVKKFNPHIRTMLITGWGSQIDPKKHDVKQADTIVRKPFRREAILNALSNLVTDEKEPESLT